MKPYNYFLLVYVLIGFTSFAQNPYFIPANTNFPVAATSINSMDVESADVDNDGDLDIVVAAEYSRNLLFFNDGDGVFTEDPARLFPEKNTTDGFSGEDSEDIAFADFDNDTDLDIIFVSEDTNFHELLINDGTGDFSFITYDFPASAGNAVAVLDLNNDTYPDIIIGNTGQNSVYINNQDLTFTQENNRWPINTEGTQDLKLVDLDNDGDLDIVEGIDLGSNNILINTNGFFTEENNRLPDTGLTLETRKITLGDVNNDTHPDIFVSTVNFIGTANLQNRLYINDGNGFFSDATTTNLPVYFRHTLDALFIDYDYDNDLDLITTDLQNPITNYHSFENNGGIFTETTADVFQAFSYNDGIGLHTADFNGDTYPDLYFSNFQEPDDLLLFSEAALSVDEYLYDTRSITYPNPVKNEFIIDVKFPMEYSALALRIYDIRGKVIKEFTQLKTTGLHLKQVVDLSKIAAGTYFYSVNNKDKRLIVGKIIKE